MPFLNITLRFPLPSDPRENLRADAEIRSSLSEFLDGLTEADGLTFSVVYEEGETVHQKRSYVRKTNGVQPSLPEAQPPDAA